MGLFLALMLTPFPQHGGDPLSPVGKDSPGLLSLFLLSVWLFCGTRDTS